MTSNNDLILDISAVIEAATNDTRENTEKSPILRTQLRHLNRNADSPYKHAKK